MVPNVALLSVNNLQFSRRNFLVCSLGSQDGGKKGIAETGEEDQIIYLTVVLKEKAFSALSRRRTS
jgi:hypothetical protein